VRLACGLALIAGFATAAAAPERLTLQWLVVRDPAVNDLEAFRLLVPAGWRSEGGVVWAHTMSTLATAALRVWDPRGAQALELMPSEPYVWAQGGIPYFNPGQIYLGNRVWPVIEDPAAFVSQYAPHVAPRLREAKVVGQVPLPEVARAIAPTVLEPGVPKEVRAARVRFEYVDHGKAIHEDVYCALVYATSPMSPGVVFWQPVRLYSFRAEKGHLDSAAPLMHTMVSSLRIGRDWYAAYMYVVQLWQQNMLQGIRSAGELSRYIAGVSEDMRRMSREAYENQQRANDRAMRGFGEYIRGVETYHNPIEGRAVELPHGYRDAWVSGNNEYILSNDPSFNPNVGDTRNWTRMRPQ
jgi:hypothetical protein